MDDTPVIVMQHYMLFDYDVLYCLYPYYYKGWTIWGNNVLSDEGTVE